MSSLELRGITKWLGTTSVVSDMSVSVSDGEAFGLLGPSGCGKTTTLNLLAGFLEPDTGSVHINGRDVSRVPPHKRNIGMVFQHYALFPHLTVAQNVAFGLRMRKTPARAAREKVSASLDLVGLSRYADRFPSELSGGQQQRVALARALAIEPTLLLMDEPLSNLDAKLRHELREEISRVQRETGVTMVFVTHDQEEALSICDRLAVMHGGRLEQVGSPTEIYQHPTSRFVAGFIGEANFLDGEVSRSGSSAPRFRFGDGCMTLGDSVGVAGGPATAMLRPEDIDLGDPGGHDGGVNAFEAVLESAVYRGTRWHCTLRIGTTSITAAVPGSALSSVDVGQPVAIRWRPEVVRILPADPAAP